MKHEKSKQPSSIAALARWINSIDAQSIPPRVLEQAKLIVLDSIGCAILGRGEETSHSLLAMTSGVRFCLASTGKPAAGKTCREEPMEMNRSALSVAARASAISCSGMAWPKEMVADFTMPPQAVQAGALPVSSITCLTQSISWRSPQDRHLA